MLLRHKVVASSGCGWACSWVNRAGAFVFYIGDRYIGVITASVTGREAGRYEFTSALPVTLLELLAPAIETRLLPAPSPAKNAQS